MTVTYGFYDSLAGDRVYNAVQLSSIFDGIIQDGVFASFGGGLIVSPNTGMNVNVAIGRAWFNHTWTLNDSNLVLAVDASEVALNRIDVVCLEVNSAIASRTNSIKVIKGTPASSPVAPTMANTSTLHQYALAELYIAAGVTTVTAPNITNKIGVTTPFVTGVVDSVDLSDLLLQYEAEFDEWFSNLVDQLSGVQVTNLQNQINTLVAENITGWNADPDTWTYSSTDDSTGIASVNANKTTTLKPGMRLKYDQVLAQTAYWNLDANSNSQVGSFNGTDTAITYSAGKFNNAAGFNGTTSKIVLTDHASLKPTGDFTIGCWIKTSSSGPRCIFQSYSINPNYSGFTLKIAGANVITAFTGKGTGTVQNIDFSQLLGTKLVNDGLDHYVVFTFNNNYAQIYVDGVLDAAGFMVTPAYAATNYVRIGCTNIAGSDIEFWNGQIDDIFFLGGYALDEETIQAKFRQQTAQGTANLTITKKAIITKVDDFSAGATLVTFWGGMDHRLANSGISNVHFSSQKCPQGFNTNPDKWSVYVDDLVSKQKTTPIATTWYNAMNTGSLPSIVIPIGEWVGFYQLIMYVTSAAAQTAINMFCTLSNAIGTESDNKTTSIVGLGGASGVLLPNATIYKALRYSLKAKETRYLNVKTNLNASDINVASSTTPTQIKLTSAYL